MAAVFLATDVRLDRRVALKVMLPGLAYSEGMAERFEQEARTAARLDHRNIVTIHAVEEADELFLFVMKLIEGRSLADLLRDAGPLPIEVVQFILLRVIDALSYAHAERVVHRDIKPGNILIDLGGEPVVTDFGIAKVAEAPSLTATGAMVGTVSYMAPEQVRGLRATPASDQYALGITLYEMLTGAVPFAGSPLEVGQHHLHSPARPLVQVRNDVPTQLASVAMRMIEKEPAARFASLREAEIALRSLPMDEERARGQLRKLAVVVTGPDEVASHPIAPPSSEPGTVASPSSWTPQTDIDAGRRRAPDDGAVTGIQLASIDEESASQLPVALRVILAAHDPDLLRARVRCEPFPFSVGRSSANGLSIPGDKSLSGTHAIIDVDATGFTIRDVSANGIHVNGRLLRRGTEPLRLGATVALSRQTAIQFVADFAPLPDLTGQIVAARFRLDERLHNSVMAATYRSTDQRLPREVIIKLFSPALMRFGQYRDEFRRQVNIAAQLEHPHICRVIDAGETILTLDGKREDVSYLYTEYMRGGSLATRLSTGVQESAETVAALVARIAAALQHAHSESIVHGDLKPSCIVYSRDGVPYVTDFALARSKESSGSVVVGSPDYLSPEQWSGQAATAASDQYSLAVVAYLLVTGALPHEGQENPAVRERNLRRRALPAHEEAALHGRPAVPSALSDVLERALHVNPAERFPSVADFATAFHEALSARRPARPSVPQVFLSYQRQASAAWAVLIARDLEEKFGCSVFVDTRAMDGAPKIPDRLRAEIERCDVFVCLLASTTLESSWVRQEIELAARYARRMVPVFQEDFQPSAAISLKNPHVDELLTHQHIYLDDRRNIRVDHTIAELGTRIRDLMS
jgi:serine/threonine-protein kinase